MPKVVKKTKCLDKTNRLGFTGTWVIKTMDFKRKKLINW